MPHQNSSQTRRRVLSAIAALPGVTAGGSPAHAALNFGDPQDGYKAHIKLRGSLGNEWVYRHYWGEVYAVLLGRLPLPLFKFEGLIKAKWTANADGTHTELLYDTSAFLDWKTGKYLEQFDNPITNEKNDVIHVWDGPNQTRYTVAGPTYPWTTKQPTDPIVLPWKIEGDYVWLTESASFERPHPLSPKDWPKASSGEKTLSSVSVTLSGRLSDLETTANSAHHQMRWTSMRSWLPWLHLGQLEGQLLTIGTGHKIDGPDQLPATMMAIIERQQPNYLTSDQPWTESMSSWERYKKVHTAPR